MKLHNPKSKAARACSKCGSPIAPGDPYFWFKWRNHHPKTIRCSSCKPTGEDMRRYSRPEWETLTADWQARIDASGECDARQDMLDELEAIASEIEDHASELRSRIENVEQYFGSECETVQLLTERADQCDEAAEQCRNVEYRDDLPGGLFS